MRPAFLPPIVAALAAFAVPSGAATLSEGTDFSGDWRAPDLIDARAADTITGTWWGHNDYDILALSGLRAGQRLTLTFAPLDEPIDYGFAAGGEVRFSTSAFRYSAWEGAAVGSPSFSYYATAPQAFEILLGDDLDAEGRAYLGLYGTHGRLGYTLAGLESGPGPQTGIDDPAGDPPAAIPLPAAGVLLLGALGGVVAVRRARG